MPVRLGLEPRSRLLAMRFLRLLLLLVALAPAAIAAAPGPPSQSQDLGRLAQDQARLAEQVRRLERLLETLAGRAREQGQSAQADLLDGARERLRGLEGAPDLPAAIEAVAESLVAMRTGEALEAQAELIAHLQALLDYLLQEHLDQQLQSLLQAAHERAVRLDALVAKQRGLLEDARERAGSSAAPAESEEEGEQGEREAEGESESEAEGEAAAGPPPQPGELAERQGEVGAEIEELIEQDPAGGSSAPLGQAQKSSERARQQLEQEQLEQAERSMEETLQQLEQARDQARAQERQAQERERLEELIDLLATAEALLARHREVETPLAGLVAEAGGERPSRREHARLRGWSEEESSIATATEQLFIEVSLGGADMFPFLLGLLIDDHQRLARDLGPGRYRARIDEVELAGALSRRWEELIAAIRTEMERVRQRIERPEEMQQPELGGEEAQKHQLLVGFAEELQLLKRVQEELTGKLERHLRRREALAASGLPLDEEDLADIDRLIERQGQLRAIYEALLERLRAESGAEEGA